MLTFAAHSFLRRHVNLQLLLVIREHSVIIALFSIDFLLLTFTDSVDRICTGKPVLRRLNRNFICSLAIDVPQCIFRHLSLGKYCHIVQEGSNRS
jgi:hypothetical protein